MNFRVYKVRKVYPSSKKKQYIGLEHAFLNQSEHFRYLWDEMFVKQAQYNIADFLKFLFDLVSVFKSVSLNN